MGDSVLPLSIANQANGVDEMNQQFEVGQHVEIRSQLGNGFAWVQGVLHKRVDEHTWEIKMKYGADYVTRDIKDIRPYNILRGEYTIVEPREDENYEPFEIPVSQEEIDEYLSHFPNALKPTLYVNQVVDVHIAHYGDLRWERGKLALSFGNNSDEWLVDLENGARIKCHINDIRPIQSDPTPQPVAPSQYPPLRNVDNNNKPLSTWKQLLRNEPLVAQQPHLYLLGSYGFLSVAETSEQYILMSSQPDADYEFFVFIITEAV